MIRTLLATTALTAVLATGALAQDASSSSVGASAASNSMSSAMPADSSAMASSLASSSMTDTTAPSAPTGAFDIAKGYSRVDTDRLATKIIGQPVFDSPATDAHNLGDINDLVLDANGKVAAVVLGVGGFLGIGEKQVAVDYSALQWVVAADNTERFVLETTVEQLTAAPDFVTVDDKPGDSSMADPGVSSSAAQ